MGCLCDKLTRVPDLSPYIGKVVPVHIASMNSDEYMVIHQTLGDEVALQHVVNDVRLTHIYEWQARSELYVYNGTYRKARGDGDFIVFRQPFVLSFVRLADIVED